MTKFTDVIIKREIWADRRARVVARSKGRILTWRFFSPKRGNTVTKLKLQFKKTQSFSDNILKSNLSKVIETTDFRKEPKISKKVKFIQGFAQTKFKGEIIRARSKTASISIDKQVLVDEAIDNLYERLAQIAGLAYDKNEGKVVAENNNLSIRTGIVYYTAK